jgi:hypothetical protein
MNPLSHASVAQRRPQHLFTPLTAQRGAAGSGALSDGGTTDWEGPGSVSAAAVTTTDPSALPPVAGRAVAAAAGAGWGSTGRGELARQLRASLRLLHADLAVGQGNVPEAFSLLKMVLPR